MNTPNKLTILRIVMAPLFLVFMLVAMYLRGTKLNKKELAAIVILGTLAASWRSECVYYLAAIPEAQSHHQFRQAVRPAGR